MVMMTTLAMLVMLVMMTALTMLVMLVVVTALAMLIMLVVMTAFAMLVMMLMLVFKMLHILCESILLFHSAEYRLTVKLIPRSSNYNSAIIIFSYNVKRLLELVFFGSLCMRENDAGCVLDLIAEKLTEVLHIHLAFVRINNGSEAVKLRLVTANCRSRLDNVGELSNSRWLNNNSVGMIFFQYLTKCL